MDFFVAILGAGIGSGTMAIVLAALQRKWKKDDDRESRYSFTPELIQTLTEKLDNVVNSQKVITTERIRYLGSCYIYAKEITLEDKETLHQMHEAYKRLGGNGHLDTVMDEVDKLQIVKQPYEKGSHQ